ncbi:MAG: hypothetical protein KIS73_02855 [Enhydrobacter sp.]|nr:hypothetical protein [Enhydrobacter sp.]
MVVDAIRCFELMQARPRRGTDMKHRLAHHSAKEDKEGSHAGKLRVP